ncbi:MAG: hydroxymethylbilane synthase [Planctomycetota bacterium]
MTPQPPLRIGTRKSPLAMWQAEYVSGRLQALGFSVEMVPITTSGDVFQGSLAQSNGVGLFTKEIQRALLEGRCDIAVHSLKDLPTIPVEGLTLAAVPPREDPADCLVSRDQKKLDSLAPGSVIGTGSPRRRAQLFQHRPDLKVADIRGNVETRLKKVADGQYDAVILALAGLKRLALENSITERLSFEQMLPAVGQAALGLETRTEDPRTIDAVSGLDHPPTHLAVDCERSVLRSLRAGCLAPVAAHAQFSENVFRMRCVVYSNDYKRWVSAEDRISAEHFVGFEPRHADNLVAGILDQLRQQHVEELIDTAI